LENKSEDMTKISLSSLENSTMISSGNRAIPKKNTLDIERIRNEAPEYHPKLFYTTGTMRGYEVPFPRPDDIEK
ncbi:35457_t:CDS:2, partial [Racocetra persica]